jgi:glycosyltransferase involved in cell wall biosynthesis
MILARLDRTAFDATVICPDSGGPLQEKMVELSVPVETITALAARFTWRPDHLARYLVSFLEVIIQLRRKIIGIDPDLIHANSVRAGLVASAATLGLGKPVIWHVHDLLPRHPFNSLIRAVAVVSRRTRLITVAQASADRFVGSFVSLRKRMTVILNGVDNKIFHPDQTARRRVRDELLLSEEAPVIGMVGRLTPSKGQIELLRAFPRVLRMFPDATLLIVGAPAFNQEHEYLHQLERTVSELGISNKVRMLGARNDVAAIMQSLDLLILNSSSEACCLVALEAMACGTPVLATRVGGMPEIIEHEKTGWLVPWNDEDALVAGTAKLIGEPALRARLAEQGKNLIASCFTIERVMNDLQNFYLKTHVQSAVVEGRSQDTQMEAKEFVSDRAVTMRM